MHNTHKTLAVGVVIASILMLVYYAVPANGISFGGTPNASLSQTKQSFTPPPAASPLRGGGGCGV
ncbi:hypothetical protein A2Z10_02730 [Candidatus Azambacteria bacterium RBG_16_47_10]|uniref:Uncharacterized protein n=1 Tax=Candidatus Azambacteria bacterium RBG_16_47_10 TaxID=1797292 RepID=A0A1F5B101_9BACT|nr:MAG: hypothetical protein A2Z10_02730 [Candidatus Azambacteria bacterium RBG_16_47_10]